MPRRLPIVVDELLTKAKQSAVLAVEIYNKPKTDFRVQAFVMLMHVAWNAVFLASFIRDGIRPYHRERNGRRYVRVDGERKTWELADCIANYWETDNNAIRANIAYFIGIRNRIEHYRDQSALSMLTFGQCQSLVANFEDFVVEKFGKEHSLIDSLSLSIQFSQFRDPARETAIINAVDRATKSITQFVKDFESSLSDDILSDMRYSFRVFLMPQIVNHSSSDTLAIQWVNVANLTKDERTQLSEIQAALIKQKQVPVRNLKGLKPTDVCKRITEQLGLKTFHPSSHHVRCWQYYGVRPRDDAADPTNCNTVYCYWDDTFKAYVYTETWVEHLLVELSEVAKYAEIFGRVPEYADGHEVVIQTEDVA